VGEKVFSITYFKMMDEIDEHFDVGIEQEKIIRDDYYRNCGSIQWNMYIYFVTNECDPKIKRMIENDHEYARKFVLDESALTFKHSHLFTKKPIPFKFTLISGPNGSGKSELLTELNPRFQRGIGSDTCPMKAAFLFPSLKFGMKNNSCGEIHAKELFSYILDMKRRMVFDEPCPPLDGMNALAFMDAVRERAMAIGGHHYVATVRPSWWHYKFLFLGDSYNENKM